MHDHLSSVLVANRGEIAVRIIRTLAELGIRSIAIYSDADRGALHTELADEAYCIGGTAPAESYLDPDKVLTAARETGAAGIHPGYGFLAENADFARACEAADIVWIGPPPAAIDAMGSKTSAREVMQAAGVPVVPGTVDAVDTLEAATAAAEDVGYPVAVKAASGGGGKGFRVAHTPAEMPDAFAGASGEGERYFGDPTVYLERYLPNPRHVEVQVLADDHGNVIHLGERDCTLQRRHQKLLEESPSPALSDEQRAHIGTIGVNAAAAIEYRGAGTIECLASEDGEIFFLEMNTRVQVEHPVTELVTGIDIVAEQLRVAAGMPLSIAQDDVQWRGHALECRINAEDAFDGYRPSSGTLRTWREPTGPWVRVDTGVRAGSVASPHYDNLLAKVIVWGPDRSTAIDRMQRALREFHVDGVDTLIPFHQAILATDEFAAGEGCHAICANPVEHLDPPVARAARVVTSPGRPSLLHTDARTITVEVDGHRHEVSIHPVTPTPADTDEHTPRAFRQTSGTSAAGPGVVAAPIPGSLVSIDVQPGQQVTAGDRLCVLEAMKMENEILAPAAGVVAEITAAVGDTVTAGQQLMKVEAALAEATAAE